MPAVPPCVGDRIVDEIMETAPPFEHIPRIKKEIREHSATF
jgi:hypothetical protein